MGKTVLVIVKSKEVHDYIKYIKPIEQQMTEKIIEHLEKKIKVKEGEENERDDLSM